MVDKGDHSRGNQFHKWENAALKYDAQVPEGQRNGYDAIHKMTRDAVEGRFHYEKPLDEDEGWEEYKPKR